MGGCGIGRYQKVRVISRPCVNDLLLLLRFWRFKQLVVFMQKARQPRPREEEKKSGHNGDKQVFLGECWLHHGFSKEICECFSVQGH